jgi:hypothetical protein
MELVHDLEFVRNLSDSSTVLREREELQLFIRS